MNALARLPVARPRPFAVHRQREGREDRSYRSFATRSSSLSGVPKATLPICRTPLRKTGVE